MSDDAAQTSSEDGSERAAYDRLEKDVTAVKNDIAHLSQQIADAVNALAGLAQTQAKRRYKNARANVDSVMADASDRAGAAADAAQDVAASIADTLEEAIQDRPIGSVALALGLGFLIGVTWRR
jgi:ElaB/YqjD/DUF883 family membrane-anchored ribosome-binding protein